MAMDDIQLALESGYPDDLAYKLYDRKAKILVAFKRIPEAVEAYKTALKYVDKVKPDGLVTRLTPTENQTHPVL